MWRDLQDGRGVRRGDHVPPHIYIKKTSTCGTTPTECWQKTSDFPKARKSPHAWVGQKKKEKPDTKEQARDLHLWEGAVKEEKFPHTRKTLHWWGGGVGGEGSFRAMKERAATRVQRAKQRDSCTEDWCRPALTNLRGLSAHPWGQVGGGS